MQCGASVTCDLQVLPVCGRADEPDYGSEDHINADPVMIQPVATIRGLTRKVSYTLLRFDSVAALPAAGGFLRAAYSERVDFIADDVNKTLSDGQLGQIWSNGAEFGVLLDSMFDCRQMVTASCCVHFAVAVVYCGAGTYFYRAVLA